LQLGASGVPDGPDSHLTLVGVFYPEGVPVQALMLLDSGATGMFMDWTFASLHGFDVTDLETPRVVTVIDGREIQGGRITQKARTLVRTGVHLELTEFHLTDLSGYPVVLGIPWLRRHNPHIQWDSNAVTFGDVCISTGCLKRPETVYAPDEVEVETRGIDPFKKMKGSITEDLVVAQMQMTREDDERARRPDLWDWDVKPTDSFQDDLDPPEYMEKLRDMVADKYHEHLGAFSKTKADTLPPTRSIDHAIELKPGTSPTYQKLYNHSQRESEELKKWLKENLEKGFIRPSKSPCSSPVLFVPKKGGEMRMCIDYRRLNDITVKDRTPLPLISETLDRLKGAKVYKKMDLRGAYNLLRVKEEDIWKTAFTTRFGLFECLVMPFGLTNAPATFQRWMNEVFQDLLDVCVVVYLDDILIYSSDQETHNGQVKEVMKRLQANGLYAKAEKCEFDTVATEFLGYDIAPTGVSMNPSKVKSVLDWAPPKNIRGLQSFLGFANYYRRFIQNYSKKIQGITALTRKGVKYSWTTAADAAFRELKESFTQAPILAHYNEERQVVLETDASSGVIGAVMSQVGDNGKLHPVAFMSKSLTPAERNYDVHDRELLAIVYCSRIWRHYLDNKYPVRILTDHKNLEYFKRDKVLSQRQARWSQLLNQISYTL
jgi:hypothetical protein